LFVISFTAHYLFPQLTMGLAPLIVILETIALKTGDERCDQAARFWAKIFPTCCPPAPARSTT
jgi:cytochrome bd ubiquinol oxidase subunit I